MRQNATLRGVGLTAEQDNTDVNPFPDNPVFTCLQYKSFENL